MVDEADFRIYLQKKLRCTLHTNLHYVGYNLAQTDRMNILRQHNGGILAFKKVFEAQLNGFL